MTEEDWAAEEVRLREERARAVRTRLVRVLTTVVRTICGAAAVILAAYIVLTVGGANPDNGITQFVSGWADNLTLGFRDLFTPADAKLRVIVNYGLAAVFWLVIGAVITGVLRRLTSPYLIS